MFTLPIGDRAVLAPLEPWQAAEFAAHLDRARQHIAPWVGAGFLVDGVGPARNVLQRYADGQARDDTRIYGIWLDATLVGGVMFVSLDAAAGVCEVGCWLEPAAEGRGLVTRAVAHLVDWAVDVRGVDRVRWVTRPDNLPSVKVARRLGMCREGVAAPDGRQDREVWSVLAARWREHRETLRR